MPSAQSEPSFFRRLITAFTMPYVGPFLIATAVGIGFYTVLMLDWAAERWIDLRHIDDLLRIYTFIAIAGLIAHFITLVRLVRRADEFVRAVTFKRVTVAAVSTLLIITIWGLLTNIGLAPALPGLFAYMLFAVINLVVIGFINTERP